MNAAQEEARSARFRARLGRSDVGLGKATDDDDDEPKCACAPAVGWKTGAAVAFVIAGVVFFNIGTEVGAAAQRRSKR